MNLNQEKYMRHQTISFIGATIVVIFTLFLRSKPYYIIDSIRGNLYLFIIFILILIATNISLAIVVKYEKILQS